MTGDRVPLAAVAARRLGAQTDFRFAQRLGWVALNDTEYHLTAHHMPLAIRIVDGAPALGAVLAPTFLAAPQVDEAGRWGALYQPIGIRTWPFVLAREPLGTRPVDELDVLPGSSRIALEGPSISVDLATGTLSPEMAAIRNTLLMVRLGKARLSAALDLLRIANLLVPLRDADGAASDFLTVDPARLEALEPIALAALAGTSFLPLDLAGALLFSRRHLDPARLPAERPPTVTEAAETPATRADPMDFVLAGLAAMNFALDASDLFDPNDPAIDWRDFAPLEPPPEREIPA